MQKPEAFCTSTSDTGETISVSCGTWQTWYRQELHKAAQTYCDSLAGGAGPPVSASGR